MRTVWKLCVLFLLSPIQNCYAKNVFLNSTVTASSYTENARYATDGNLDSAWNSQRYAPAWIQIEVPENHAPIKALRLTPAQTPSGNTSHAVTAQKTDGTWIDIANINQYTADKDPIDILISQPLIGIKKLRIETTGSPSWVAWYEIQALSESDVAEGNAALAREEAKKNAAQIKEERCLQNAACMRKKELDEKARIVAEREGQRKAAIAREREEARACNNYYSGYVGNIQFKEEEQGFFGTRNANYYGGFIVIASRNGNVTIQGVNNGRWRGGGNYPSLGTYKTISCTRLRDIEN